MPKLFSVSQIQKIAWGMAIAYIILFSFGSLATATIAAFTGVDWSALSHTKRMVIVVAIIANWAGTMLAFLNTSLQKMNDYINSQPPDAPAATSAVASIQVINPQAAPAAETKTSP
jgi:hypothetical protein